MKRLSDECELSFYTIMDKLTEKGNVFLVRNNFTDILYVKKELSKYNMNVYKVLKNNPHHNIVFFKDFFLIDEKLIILEEFIYGKTLEEIVENEGPLTEERAAYYLDQICDALIHLHSLHPPIINRDIKLSNIMLDSNDCIKLIDFDVSRQFINTQNKDTELLGTVGYAAPEQYGFGQTDIRTDIYALGILYNYLLTGKHPQECLYKGRTRKIIEKCINIDPEKRFQSASGIKNTLLQERIVASERKNINIEAEKNLRVIKNNTKSQMIDNKKSSFKMNFPGFRTGKVWKMVIAIIFYYLMIDLLLFSAREDGGSIAAYINAFVMVVSLMIGVFVYIDYITPVLTLPFATHENILIRLLAKTVYAIFTFIITAFTGLVLLEIIKLVFPFIK